MADLTDAARDWLRAHHRAVLITLRADGTPQSSNIVYGYDGSTARVSVTADRAKTRNVQRDGRTVLHVLGDDFWSYAAVTCTGSAGPVSTASGDAAGRDLLDLYDSVAPKPHPDPETFLATMVAEQRLVLTLTPQSVVGSGW